jgi:pimeloyl-ACP methyl ester carboxylesterase
MDVRLRTDDRHLSYKVHGTGPDLLFMHGLGADRHQAEHCLDALDGFRVITLDLPGHGASSLSRDRSLTDQVGFQAYAETAADLLSSLGVTSAYVGGISMGAGVALTLAMSSPELVTGLLLIRPAWINAPARPHLDLLADIGDWIVSGGEGSARQQLVADPRFLEMNSTVPMCANGLIDTIVRPHVTAAPSVLPTMVDDHPYQSDVDLEQCTMPALVVSCEHDPLHPRWVADHLEASLPNATGHIAPPRYLQPERHERAVADVIRSFLGQCVEPATNHHPATTAAPTGGPT